MHLLAMLAFSVIVGVIFAAVTSEVNTPRERVIYGVKVFGSFVGISLLISWIFYYLQM
ncbi:MAG: hypothetical protein JNN15_01235 [Blastocatellia bacterium]|nr:hypothetical protein [Blastocatellia bacterium]